MADKTNAKGDDYARNATYGWVISGVGAAVLGFSVYKVLTSDSGSSKEHAVRGKRQRKDRTFVVTPVASPKGGGATLRVDW